MDNEAPDNKKDAPNSPEGQDTAVHIPITHRPYVGSNNPTGNNPEETKKDDEPEQPHILAPSHRNVIKPLNDNIKPEEPEPEEKKPDTQKYMDTKPPAKKAATAPPAPADIEAPSGETPKEAPLNSEDIPVVPDADKQAKAPNKDDEKRKEEIENIIESHKYFIPVYATARRQSIKINFGLTILILVLAFALIDLMLDSGTILLVQKVPHTHFFSIGK
jgi:hypothetical protein